MTLFWRQYRGRVRRELQETGTAIVHPVASWIFPSTKRSQSPLAVCFSAGLLEHWTHVGDAGFYIAVGESRKHDHEAQRGWAQQKLRRMESREGRALFSIRFAPWVTIPAQLIEKKRFMLRISINIYLVNWIPFAGFEMPPLNVLFSHWYIVCFSCQPAKQ